MNPLVLGNLVSSSYVRHVERTDRVEDPAHGEEERRNGAGRPLGRWRRRKVWDTPLSLDAHET